MLISSLPPTIINLLRATGISAALEGGTVEDAISQINVLKSRLSFSAKNNQFIGVLDALVYGLNDFIQPIELSVPEISQLCQILETAMLDLEKLHYSLPRVQLVERCREWSSELRARAKLPRQDPN